MNILSIFFIISLNNTLKFEDFLIKVEKNSLQLKSVKIDKDISTLDLQKNKSLYFPKADFQLSYQNSTMQEAISDKNNPFWKKSLSISLPLFLGGSRVIQERLLKIALNQSDLTYNSAKERIFGEVIKLFSNIFIQTNKIEHLKKSISIAKENFNYIEELFKVERATKLELDTFQLVLEERELALIQSQFELNKEWDSLSYYISENSLIFDFVAFPETVDNILIKVDDSDFYEKSHSKWLKNSIILKQYKELIKYSEISEDLSYTEFLPKLSMYYNYDSGNFENPFTDRLSKQSHLFGISLNFNIFNGFQDTINLKKSKLQTVKQKIEYLDAQNEYETVLKQMIITLNSLQKQYNIYKKTVELSQKKIDESNILYKEGKITYIELLDNENAYITNKLKFLEVEGSIYNTYYQLLVFIGDIK
ncbi:TolC family protein [bacterium]|nr:TolC family protein [bacterium]